mmetsp:Transcript_7258/g.21425  ORF Transcript_7258/g.21425 Transcript_7258/m.21425 type:complete len:234 (-) Transcript_7258:231-932(-)
MRRSGNAFHDSLIHHYTPATFPRLQRAKFAALKQGATQSAQAYVDAHNRLAATISDLGNSERVFSFLRGLHPTLRSNVEAHAHAHPEDKILDLNFLFQMAITLDPFHGGSHRTPFTSGAHTGPVPMELGTITAVAAATTPTTGRRTKLTDKERAHLMSVNGCLYSREPNANHVAADCPLNTRKSSTPARRETASLGGNAAGQLLHHRGFHRPRPRPPLLHLHRHRSLDRPGPQ